MATGDTKSPHHGVDGLQCFCEPVDDQGELVFAHVDQTLLVLVHILDRLRRVQTRPDRQLFPQRRRQSFQHWCVASTISAEPEGLTSPNLVHAGSPNSFPVAAKRGGESAARGGGSKLFVDEAGSAKSPLPAPKQESRALKTGASRVFETFEEGAGLGPTSVFCPGRSADNFRSIL